MTHVCPSRAFFLPCLFKGPGKKRVIFTQIGWNHGVPLWGTIDSPFCLPLECSIPPSNHSFFNLSTNSCKATRKSWGKVTLLSKLAALKNLSYYCCSTRHTLQSAFVCARLQYNLHKSPFSLYYVHPRIKLKLLSKHIYYPLSHCDRQRIYSCSN